ncbi:uncharacterized membrane protein YgdD (TMEM256/DUF423 family) [Angulomicrobium tetraedrale]|uniref:Uncharacterized membrane protein YgdD (TMEM256/DUF423 family) n=1 Tax=Ancylobacter tetraedralis TaxID=217068 RepID=A0A839ZEM7_9HYPH|nr:hypothetical protein [Ancylobacter tetraedralis]MBB3773214.1 uncharacterized membrane protein YgdD (TMEM256/DUF423 family) [Ancylobacter tetraedralis]
MNRNALYALIAVLLVALGAVGVYAYQQHEEDKNSLEIKLGPNGIKVDPPSN